MEAKLLFFYFDHVHSPPSAWFEKWLQCMNGTKSESISILLCEGICRHDSAYTWSLNFREDWGDARVRRVLWRMERAALYLSRLTCYILAT